jgi:SEC-C motif-containing protein
VVLEQRPCPCGVGTYDEHCGRLHRGEAQATSPEELMRSRYSAYAVGDTAYVWRTWHPRTRPPQVTEHGLRWTGLDVVDAHDDAGSGVVEFVARHEDGVLHEVSRFEQRAGRWFYVDGVSGTG